MASSCADKWTGGLLADGQGQVSCLACISESARFIKDVDTWNLLANKGECGCNCQEARSDFNAWAGQNHILSTSKIWSIGLHPLFHPEVTSGPVGLRPLLCLEVCDLFANTGLKPSPVLLL